MGIAISGTSGVSRSGRIEPSIIGDRKVTPAISISGVCQRRKRLPLRAHWFSAISAVLQNAFILDSRADQLWRADVLSAAACKSTTAWVLPGEKGTYRNGSTRGDTGAT